MPTELKVTLVVAFCCATATNNFSFGDPSHVIENDGPVVLALVTLPLPVLASLAIAIYLLYGAESTT